MANFIKKETNVFILSPFGFMTFLAFAPLLKILALDIIPYNSTNMRLIFNPYPVALAVTRDADDNIIHMEGVAVEVLKWLSVFDHFTYTDTKIVTPFVENLTKTIGSIHYLKQGYADLLIVPIILTAERLNNLFLPHPWNEDVFVLVIPAPTTETNISSITQPFQPIVWILILVSIVVMISFLYVLTSPKLTSFGRPINNMVESDRFGKICFFVFGLLFSQGGSLQLDHLKGRIAVMTWGLAAFVLVQAYCCILTSFLTTPTYVNLANSPEELASKTNVRLVVRLGYIPDAIISNSQDPLYKTLAKKLNTYPNSRCANLPDCMEQVASGGHVLINGLGAVLDAMHTDYQKTGRCRFSIARKTMFTRFSTFGLTKNSTRKESFNRGILQLRENGFLDKWTDQFQPKPRRCLDEIDNKPSGEPKKLTLAGLSGAFLILGVGVSASVLSFIIEILLGYRPVFKKKIVNPQVIIDIAINT